jgi:hypothetical protein
MMDFLRRKTAVAHTLDICRDTAQQTQVRMLGGWLLDLAAFPGLDKVELVEHWVCEANEKAWALRDQDAAESARWYSIAEELAAIVAHCASVRRARATGNSGAQPSPMQRALSGVLRSGGVATTLRATSTESA